MIDFLPKLKEFFDQIQPRCVSIVEVDDGILVTPKRGLPGVQSIRLHQKLMTVGATYNPGPYTYLITKEYIVRQHLDKLRYIFQKSQTEIEESLWLLINLGVTVNRIQDETGRPFRAAGIVGGDCRRGEAQ